MLRWSVIVILALMTSAYAGERPPPKVKIIDVYDWGYIRGTLNEEGEVVPIRDVGTRLKTMNDAAEKLPSVKDAASSIPSIKDATQTLVFERDAGEVLEPKVDSAQVVETKKDASQAIEQLFDASHVLTAIKDESGRAFRTLSDPRSDLFHSKDDPTSGNPYLADAPRTIKQVVDTVRGINRITDSAHGVSHITDVSHVVFLFGDKGSAPTYRPTRDTGLDDIFRRNSSEWVANHRAVQSEWRKNAKRNRVNIHDWNEFDDSNTVILRFDAFDSEVGKPDLIIFDTDRYGRIGPEWSKIIQRVKPRAVVLNWTNCMNRGHDYSQTWAETANNIAALDGFVKLYSPDTMTFVGVVHGTAGAAEWAWTFWRAGSPGDGVAFIGPTFFAGVNTAGGIFNTLGALWKDEESAWNLKPALWMNFVGEYPKTDSFDRRMEAAKERMKSEGFYGVHVTELNGYDPLRIAIVRLNNELNALVRQGQVPNDFVALSRLVAENTGMPFISAYAAIRGAFPNEEVDDSLAWKYAQFGEDIDNQSVFVTNGIDWFIKKGVEAGIQPTVGATSEFICSAYNGNFSAANLRWAVSNVDRSVWEPALVSAIDSMNVRYMKDVYLSVLEAYGGGQMSPNGFLEFINSMKLKASTSEGELMTWMDEEYERVKQIVDEDIN